MKKGIAIVAMLCMGITLGAFYWQMNGKTPSPMQAFEGTYVGLAPTNESAVGMGEIEMTIGKRTIDIRRATGLRIQEEHLMVDSFEPMSVEEVNLEYANRSPLTGKTVGFKDKKDFIVKLLFIKDPTENEIGLVFRTGDDRELLGPTILFNPTQIKQGLFERGVERLELQFGKGVLPRLRNGGKAGK